MTRSSFKFLFGFFLALTSTHAVLAQDWQRLGPEGGMVVSLGSTAKGALYLGTADGHIFFSDNRGQSWELRGRVGNRLDAVVTRLLADPRDENRIYAAAWYQAAGAAGGVFRSEDGGRTWTLLGLPTEAVRALELAPSHPDILVAGTRSGVFRSPDAGKTWQRITAADDPELRNIDSLAIDPQNPDVLYVGTYHLPWKTENAGKSWVPVIAGIIDDSDIMSLRIDSTNPQRLFMSACSGIYRSDDQGAQWIKLQGIPYAARRTQAIIQDPGTPKTLFAGTTEGLWVTRDAGESWTRTTTKDWVVNSVVILPANSQEPERVVLGTENQGIEISDDAGVHFSQANRGFTHVIVNQLLADRTQPAHLLTVLERSEEKILESRDSGQTWTAIPLTAVVHGKSLRLNADHVQQAYASPWGWLMRLSDGKFWLHNGAKGTWTEWNLRLPAAKPGAKKSQRTRAAALPERRIEVSGTEIALSDSAALVPASIGLLRCQSSGICATLKAFAGRGGPIRAVWASPNGQTIAVVRDGKLATSANAGESAAWRDLPVADNQVLWLDIADADSNRTIFLGTDTGLYISQGAENSWTRVRGGLPDGTVTHFLRQPNFWIATQRNGGFYLSTDHGATWQRLDRDAERGQFTALLPLSPTTVLASSQSEALLKLTLPAK